MLVGKCSVADPSSHDALPNSNTRFLSEEATKEFHVVKKFSSFKIS